MDVPLRADAEDPLAQPTRARLFALLGELKRPVATAELAERLRLHPNGVRIHLERLQSAGLVSRDRAHQPRGRPRDAWTISPQASPGGRAPSAYAELSRWLARAIRPGQNVSLRRIEATGREIGREIAPRTGSVTLTGAAAEDALGAALASLGFQPRMAEHAGGRQTFCLGNCPYRDAVRENQPAVCALHRGITRGLLDVLAPKAKMARFVPHDPDEAGCLIELSGLPPAVPASGGSS